MHIFTQAFEWARSHKVQVSAAAAALVGLAGHFLPGFPGEAILRAVALLLGA